MVGDQENLEANEETKQEEEMQIGDLESALRVVEEEREKADRYLSNWQRAEADLINYKKRSEQEKAETTTFANVNLIMDLLPLLDDFERALENVPEDPAGHAWVDGVALIYRKVKTVLENRGLEEIAAEGQEFDPNVHDAVMCMEGEEGKVISQIRKGYKFRDRVIRPATVIVGKERTDTQNEE